LEKPSDDQNAKTIFVTAGLLFFALIVIGSKIIEFELVGMRMAPHHNGRAFGHDRASEG
jgi:hypothetical protein